MDEINMLYNSSWDTPMRRASWITLRTIAGLKTARRHLPADLKSGVAGRNFEVT